MMKMFYAKKFIDVCFVLEVDDSVEFPASFDQYLNNKSEFFLKEEDKNLVSGRLIVKEVNSLSDIPKDWWNACYWGDNPNDACPSDFLQDPEYTEYLRLKAKFE